MTALRSPRALLLVGLSAAAVAAFTLSSAAPQRLRGERRPLPNGRLVTEPVDAPVTLLPVRSTPLVAVRVVLRVGSQDDPPGKEGLAALTAALVARGGTRFLTYDQLLDRLYPMAAAVEHACRKEVTTFSGVVHRDNARNYLGLMSAMLTTPRLGSDDLERLRTEAIDFIEHTLRGDDDEELARAALQGELYRGHPYGHLDTGTVAGLKAITIEDVQEFHASHYTREALELGFAGGIDSRPVNEFRSLLGTLPSGGIAAPALPRPNPPVGLDVTLIERPANATAIALGFPIDVTRRDDDYPMLAVANAYLGDHRTFNGKLVHDLRQLRGLNYGDFSYVEDFIQDGDSTFPVPNNPRRQQYFSIRLRPVPNDKAAFALRAALWELDRLTRKGLAPAEFEATRGYLLNASKLWGQTLSRRVGYSMDGAFYGRNDLATELNHRLPLLTAEAVNAAVRRHLAPDGIKVVIVTRHDRALEKVLTDGKPTPLVYDTAGTPQPVLDEDRLIAAFPLKNLHVKVVPVNDVFER